MTVRIAENYYYIKDTQLIMMQLTMALSKRLLMRKATETMNIPARPKLTGLTIHCCNEVWFLVMLQIYKFLSHWMACKSQYSDLSSQANIDL